MKMCKQINDYKDASGLAYELDDIVFNPFFGDYWVVKELTEEEQQIYGMDNKYCFALWNYLDHYCTEIDAPQGFEIVIRKGEPDYEQALKEFAEIIQKMEEIENGHKTEEDD